MKVLIANRGEIACRIIATLREMGLGSVAVYTKHDVDAPHVALADEAAPLHGELGYLDIAALVNAATERGATLLHPGYGFVSQSPELVQACADANVTYIGCSSEAMRLLGDKGSARRLAQNLGIPVIPGAETVNSSAAAQKAADTIGYPVLLKSAKGGGGRGMRRVNHHDEMPDAFVAAQREATASSNSNHLLLEKYVGKARHIEVQILANGRDAVALGERECSLQRRYQKIIEEAPAAIDDTLRQRVVEAALVLVKNTHYASACTVEFLVEPGGAWYFLEVNTRLQVEHSVTELVSGIDIVRSQIEIALGGALPIVTTVHGHAIEARLNAEDPYHGFTPQVGEVLLLELPHLPGVRIDAGIRQGSVVSPHYDSLLAKITAHAHTREEATKRLAAALRRLTLLGVVTNQSFLLQVLEEPFFSNAETFTDTIEARAWQASPMPTYAHEAAEHALAAIPTRISNDSERHELSPWQALGAYRVGQ